DHAKSPTINAPPSPAFNRGAPVPSRVAQPGPMTVYDLTARGGSSAPAPHCSSATVANRPSGNVHHQMFPPETCTACATSSGKVAMSRGTSVNPIDTDGSRPRTASPLKNVTAEPTI